MKGLLNRLITMKGLLNHLMKGLLNRLINNDGLLNGLINNERFIKPS